MVMRLLRVDFPLGAGTADERLLKVHELQGKIRSMELGARPDSASPTCNCGCKGEPLFLFVAKVSTEERTRALAHAYAQAKEAAGRLALASRAELGALQSLMEVNAQPACTNCPLAQNQAEPSSDGTLE